MPSSFDFLWSPYGHVDFSFLVFRIHDVILWSTAWARRLAFGVMPCLVISPCVLSADGFDA